MTISNHHTTIESLSHEGRGIAHDQNKTIFIDNALPGEQVDYVINKKKRKIVEGLATHIHNPSPERVTAKCAHYLNCGGCSLQHWQHDKQVAHKQKILLEQLKHFGNVTPEKIIPALTGDIWGYRRKARLGVKFVEKKQKLLIGFRETNGRYLADVTRCEILHPAIGEKLPQIAQCLSQLSVYQQIPQIEVAIGDTEVALIVRHLQPLTDADHAHLIDFAKQHHVQIYLQPKGPDSVEILYPDIAPRLHYQLPEFDLTFEFHPNDFTQVNSSINQQMVNLALALMDIEPHERVLDLFCGLGNFTLPMARKAQHVVGVEGSDEMVKRGYDNARLNHIENVEFHAANLADKELNQPWLQQTYDKILLDPPRSGAEEIIPKLIQCQAKRIVYVSCNPATLARDAGILVNQYQYRLKQAGIMDMFPHTRHVESIAVFEK